MQVWIVEFQWGQYSDAGTIIDSCFADGDDAVEYVVERNNEIAKLFDNAGRDMNTWTKQEHKFANILINGKEVNVCWYGGKTNDKFVLSGPYGVKE